MADQKSPRTPLVLSPEGLFRYQPICNEPCLGACNAIWPQKGSSHLLLRCTTESLYLTNGPLGLR